MASNLDFCKEHRELSLDDCAMMQIAFISCQKRREQDMYKVYEHFQRCRYYCQEHVAYQMNFDRRYAGAPCISRDEMMEDWEKKLLNLQRVQEEAYEEAQLYLTGAYGI